MLHKDCPDQEEKSDEAALQTEKDEETDITYVNVWSHGQMTPKQLSRCLRTIVAVKPEISQFWTTHSTHRNPEKFGFSAAKDSSNLAEAPF